MKNKIICGDAIEEMKKLPENSVDAIITDPPYGIGFMGKEWDNFNPSQIDESMEKDKRPHIKIASQRRSNTAGTYDLSKRGMLGFQEWFYEVSKECIRVLKPGGFLLSFGGTRTYHRLVCGIEDAGFEIRDTIMWLYGSGFPKSLNIGKQIDKIQGNEREVVGISKGKGYSSQQEKNLEHGFRPYKKGLPFERADRTLTKGISEWEGWGTALKPACEPIVVARKPLSEKNVALNVLKHGTGGLNIDECRIDYISEEEKRKAVAMQDKPSQDIRSNSYNKQGIPNREENVRGDYSKGRFPSNIILDEEAGKMLDEQSGELSSGVMEGKQGGFGNSKLVYGDNSKIPNAISFGDKGGASRFFYCAKSSKGEREFGLIGQIPCVNCGKINSKTHKDDKGRIVNCSRNNHPTVKPIKLMEYLIKLVTREGAKVLDPFGGTGTTTIACIKLGRMPILIEKEEEYVKIANARIKPFLEQKKLG